MSVKKCNKCKLELDIDAYFSKSGKDKNGNQNYKGSCKICEWEKAHKGLELDKDDRIIIEKILTKKVKYINDLLDYVNLDLLEICNRIKDKLNIANKIGLVKTVCKNCGKEFIVTLSVYLTSENHYCTKSCNYTARKGININNIIGKGKCEECGSTFNIRSNTKSQRFCNANCKTAFYSKEDRNQVEVECRYCSKKYKKFKGKVNENNFCSTECQIKYRYELALENKEDRLCEICGEEFQCNKTSTQRFCSVGCQNKWQTTLVGELSGSFNSVEVKCEYCGKLHFRSPSKMDIKTHYLCSNECRRDWFREIWSQREDVKIASRKRAVKMLENGEFSHTETNCQIIVNSMLDNLNIKFINEKNIDNYYTVDNYLTEYNLIIEVMGTYWHTDPRKYKEINYKTQLDRINRDKAKHAHIKNKYNIDILYLWEKDIIDNPKICEKIIIDYISNKGILDNYHSFNYKNESKKLKPYQEWDIKDINNITSLKLKTSISRKQQDKWIKYNCEICGKESEQLISHYVKNKRHYCSRECHTKGLIKT